MTRNWTEWTTQANCVMEGQRGIALCVDDYAEKIVADHNALAGRNPRALGETCRTMRALIDKLRLVIPALNGVTVMAYVHGMKYDGPTINEELEAADTALRAFEREG